MSSGLRLGVDTGGTFTDCVRVDESGIAVYKLRSQPEDPSRAILAGVRELVGDAAEFEITHGSTVATNALLERKGARVALVTTAGFEDVLLIGRQTRAELYNFMVESRRPLIEPGMTFGVRERLAADGSVLEALEEAEVARVVDALRRVRADSVAVCLLHSYANGAHERVLAGALTEAGFAVSASHEILPEYREFERWATTAVNAYVTPLMARYLLRLEAALEGHSLRIMQSNGGSISSARAREAAVQTILSGPAAGVVGAQAVGAASGFHEADHVRYGRDVDRCGAGGWGDRDDDGVGGWGFSGEAADAGYPYGGRGRRVGGVCGWRRQPAGGAAQRGRGAGAGVLRQGR